MVRSIVRLSDDKYLEWSSIVDAPVSYIATRAQAVSRWGTKRVAQAEPLTGFNRAGPHEECLTLEALARRYSCPEACDAPLQVSDIQPIWTNWFLDDGEEEDEHGPVYAWRPWRPGEEPAEMPSPEEYHDMWTRILPDELDRLVTEAKRARGEA